MIPKLSICIPVYNGSEFLSETLDSIIKQQGFSDIEIVISDDVSTDMSYSIAKEYGIKYKNIVVSKNEINLKMDGNFVKVASLANGEYIWFCGQDDIIGDGAIEKVLGIIIQNQSIDFIYMNYKQCDHNLKNIIKEKKLLIDEDILFNNYLQFINFTKLENLPTFLPAFILRKELWDSIDPKQFYGTQYIQLGIFLSLIKRLKSYIVSYPYVIGRVPYDGWHKNKITLLDIISGNLEVITYIYSNKKGTLPNEIYYPYYKLQLRSIFGLIIDIKNSDISKIDQKIWKRIKYLFPISQFIYLKIIMNIPRTIFRFLYKIKNLRFLLKKIMIR